MSTNRIEHFSTIGFQNLAFEKIISQRKYKSVEDVLIKISNNSVEHAHAIVLASRFEYFRKKFAGKSRKEFEINLPEKYSQNALKHLINYAYSGQITINTDNVNEIVLLARKLKSPKVIDWCCTFIEDRLTVWNVPLYINFAQTNKIKCILNKCTSLIQKSFNNYVNCDSFENINYESFLKIISTDTLEVVSEKLVLSAIRKWTKEGHKPLTFEQLKNLFCSVRWDFVKQDDSFELLYYIFKDFKKIYEDNVIVFHNHKRTPRESYGRDIKNSILLVGLSKEEDSTNILERFDFPTKTTSFICKLPKRRLATIVCVNRNIFCIGGLLKGGELSNSVDCFNVTSKQLISPPLANFNIERCSAAAVVMSETNVFLSGGMGNGWKRQTSCELYNLSTNSWNLLNNPGQLMQIGRDNHGLACLPGKRLFVFGGFGDGGKRLCSVESIQLGESQWKFLAPMEEEKENSKCAVTEFGGKIIVARLSSVGIFTPPKFATDSGLGSWLRISSNKKQFGCQSVLISQNCIFVFDRDSDIGVDEFSVKEGTYKCLKEAVKKETFENFQWSAFSYPLTKFEYIYGAVLIETDII